MKEINQILDFIVEIEKLKGVIRKSRPVGLGRYENSGEHCWHVCLSALLLKDFSNDPIDINRVIKMLLIHDLGEIDADDVIIYSSETDKQKTNEEECVKRLLDILPKGMGDEYLEIWQEFETGDTNDAKFAKAIDRIPPLLHNVNDDGHTWKKNNISKEKVFDLNSKRISSDSTKLWETIECTLNKAVEQGMLK